MNISIIMTLKNESESIDELFESIYSQSIPINEIVILNDGSTDDTLDKIKAWSNRFNIKIFSKSFHNISKGRNYAIARTSNDIIICIDGGCVLSEDYIKNITKPFNKRDVYFVGGITKPIAKTFFESCLALFIQKREVPKNYLPKGHAMAFHKSLWSKIRGFREDLLAAEDTYFSIEAIKYGFSPIIVKNAIIYWRLRKGLPELWVQFKKYGYYDGIAFNFRMLPLNSKFVLAISILVPIALIHAVYKGFSVLNSTKRLKGFYYGFLIDLTKIYSYSYGFLSSKIGHKK